MVAGSGAGGYHWEISLTSSFATVLERNLSLLSGAALVYSTFLGGFGIDDGMYLVKLNPAASAILYSTFLDGAGGSLSALNSDGSVWLAGGAGPNSFVTPDAWDTQFSGGNSDAYVASSTPPRQRSSTPRSWAGPTRRAPPISRSARTATSTSPAGRSRRTSPPRQAHSIAPTGGDSFILGAEAWVAKIGFDPNAPTPPAIPVAPILVSPAAGASVAQPVTFDWNDVSGVASYTIQVDEISAFGAPLILAASVATSSFTTGALPAGNWFWRVRAVNSAGTPGPWSEVRSITVQQAPQPSPSPSPSAPLPAPALLSPANDARFSPGTTVSFDWGDVTGAASYLIQIDNSESFGAPFTVEATVTASQCTAIGLPIQRMWWRVRAAAANGTPGNWSGSRRFELKQ